MLMRSKHFNYEYTALFKSAGKSHNLIGQGIFHGDQKSLFMKNPET
jgi:hypothetical protein